MPVSIDTVYQRVLSLANKEQRGYITPQEFNLYANQAQLEILNQYFYDINQWSRQHGSSHEYADMLDLIYEKIAVLNVRLLGLPVTTGIFELTGPTSPINIPGIRFYKLGSVFFNNPDNNRSTEIEEVSYNEYEKMAMAPLTRPTLNRPVYVNRIDGLNIYPDNIELIDISFVKAPNVVEWAYVVVNDKALYNDNISVDFELHSSEETELVYKILKLAGVNLKQPDVAQVADAMESGQVKQEKI